MSTIANTLRHFTPRLRRRLKTAGIGLGLTRLLLDAGRTKEARKTLSSLQSAFGRQGTTAADSRRHAIGR